MMGSRRIAGFSLIEIMAAVFLTSIVMGVAVSFQVSLGRATAAARERLRYQRHAVTLLDRVARDLAGAYFIAQPQGGDPNENGWIFIASNLGEDGGDSTKSNAVKFVTRNYQPQGLEEHVSDIAVMSYFLNKSEDGFGYQLVRWRKPRLPEFFDPEYPLPDDPLSEIVGENLARFELSFIDTHGGESDTWNSSEREGFDSTPLAVRIEIAMVDPNYAPEDHDEFDDADFDDVDFDDDYENDDGHDEPNPNVFAKTALVTVRPLDWRILEKETIKAANDAGDFDDDDDDDDFDDFDDGEDDEIDGDGNPPIPLPHEAMQ